VIGRILMLMSMQRIENAIVLPNMPFFICFFLHQNGLLINST
jgi:hypothetical protein